MKRHITRIMALMVTVPILFNSINIISDAETGDADIIVIDDSTDIEIVSDDEIVVYQDDEVITDSTDTEADEPSVSNPDSDSRTVVFENSAASENEGIYTVSYVCIESDGFNIPVDNKKYNEGDVACISNVVPVRNGYTFWGWSLTGDNDCVYTAGWNFEVTSDVTFYATWAEEADDFMLESYSGRGNKYVQAINKYVNSLKGSFNPVYYYGGSLKSIQCCAFTDQIWSHVFNISRYNKNPKYKVYNSKKKLKGSEIYEFLKANNARSGDIIWCHDPSYAKDYNITHYMILMDYDRDSITITDGYEKNGKGIVWKNNQRISYTGDHAKYFSGKCYVRLYHISDQNVLNSVR